MNQIFFKKNPDRLAVKTHNVQMLVLDTERFLKKKKKEGRNKETKPRNNTLILLNSLRNTHHMHFQQVWCHDMHWYTIFSYLQGTQSQSGTDKQAYSGKWECYHPAEQCYQVQTFRLRRQFIKAFSIWRPPYPNIKCTFYPAGRFLQSIFEAKVDGSNYPVNDVFRVCISCLLWRFDHVGRSLLPNRKL